MRQPFLVDLQGADNLAQSFARLNLTVDRLNPCVWHLAPLPANAAELCAVIVLPSCTYINDCTVVDLKEDEQFTIVK